MKTVFLALALILAACNAKPELEMIELPREALPVDALEAINRVESQSLQPNAISFALQGAGGNFVDANGIKRGYVLAINSGNRVLVITSVNGISNGLHGVHVHAGGACANSSSNGVTTVFGAAKAHWDAAGTLKHGRLEDARTAAHAGDLGNINVIENRSWRAVSVGKFNGLEVRGLTVIVHAIADDGVTQPTGNSGARILCAQLR